MNIYIVHVIFLLGLFLFADSSSLLAQHTHKVRPEKIGGLAKEDKPISYYKEQAQLWQATIKEDPNYAEGWNYYYKAERAKLQLEQPDLWAHDKKAFYAKLAPILVEAKKHIGHTFEYYYIKGLNAEGPTAMDALKKAYATDPERSEVYGWLFSKYVPRFKKQECQDLAKRMLSSNIYSDANLKWNYNALASVEKNGVIVSNGDMDGIPKWVLQYGAGIRQDVIVTNKWLLASDDEYRKKTYQQIGINLPELNESDFKNMTLYADYLAADVLKRSERPAYISSGTQLQFIKDHGLEGNMYVVGNALKYSNKRFDNTAAIIENFEENYYLEHLFQHFQKHPEDDVVKTQMNLTYLPGLIHLKNYYKSTQLDHKYSYYNALIDRIAEDSGRKEEVLKWFDQ